MPKCMLFDGLEPRLALYSSLISHFRHFQKMSKNQCKKGIQISCFLMQNWDFWTPRSIDSALLVVFGRCRKIVIFYVGLGRPKNDTNSILSRPRDPRVTPGVAFLRGLQTPRAQTPPDVRGFGRFLLLTFLTVALGLRS